MLPLSVLSIMSIFQVVSQNTHTMNSKQFNINVIDCMASISFGQVEACKTARRTMRTRLRHGYSEPRAEA